MTTHCPGSFGERGKYVISGISGRFPDSDNMEEFKKNLYDGVDLVVKDDRRWPSGMYGLQPRNGKIRNLEHFDALFFGIHPKLSHGMDPQLRILLELTFEAIMDSGVNPSEIRGTNVGVFLGLWQNEVEGYYASTVERVNGYGISGCCRAMIANRISYTFDFRGPSMSLDTACSSSSVALHQALLSLDAGECDSAIIGGTNLLLNPNTSCQFFSFGALCTDGKCKTFDASANGYVRSEAVVIIYIQKKQCSRRIYATIEASGLNTDGYKEEGALSPTSASQQELFRNVYNKAGVDPLDVSYIEAHGTGTAVGDPEEVSAITGTFCKNRKTPLLIGAVKTNMGHPEAVSGLCALAKVLIAFENNLIPANLHFKVPNPKLTAICDGRIKVVTENHPWNGGLVALNCFGVGGVNAHLVISENPKPKLLPTKEQLPRLILVSGRTEEGVSTFLDELQTKKDDEELLALVNAIHSSNIKGHHYRGYRLLEGDFDMEISSVAEERPVWFIYSGMGSQWPGMGRDLMKLEVFKNTIKKCSAAIEKYGVNLEDILLNDDPKIFDNLLNCFAAITAVQIALTDVLADLGIQPEGMIGHSMGEIGCAYADGTLTAEQAMVISYSRGRATLASDLIPGGMAAVALSWEECKELCPEEIQLACHNGPKSITISGPIEVVDNFVKDLQTRDIFARMVKCGGFAFHSKYVADAATKLHEMLKGIVPHPKPRSKRWLSSSIPESAWKTPMAKLSSVEYQVNNLLSPVLFYDTIQHIPNDAIVIEIAPHTFMQPILKQSLDPNIVNVGLVKRNHKNNIHFLLTNIGRIYNAGAQPKISNLYPSVTFPVGKGTPMISPMVKWDHSAKWYVPDFCEMSTNSGVIVMEIDLNKEEYQYISGHTIDGRVLFPAAGYLTLVWKAFASFKNEDIEQTSVKFENIRFSRATIMSTATPTKFIINIFEDSGLFQITESGDIVAFGQISVYEEKHDDFASDLKVSATFENGSALLQKADIYKELALRGYEYKDAFQGIVESHISGTYGKLEWKNCWTSFIDCLLQHSLLGIMSRELYLPESLLCVTIDTKLQKKLNFGDMIQLLGTYTWEQSFPI